MSIATMLFELGMQGGAAIAAVGVAFILVMAGVALLAYRMLRKTMKWAFRMAIVGVILMIALIGGGIMIWYSMKSTPAPPRRAEPTRPRR
jgi:uncharacterized membrane protein YqjE